MAPNLEIESGDDLVRLTVESGIPYRSYNDLTDIPEINNVPVKGSLSLEDLGIENSKIYIAELNVENDVYSLAGTFEDLKSAYNSGKLCILRCIDKNDYAFLYKPSALIDNFFAQRFSVATTLPAKLNVKTFLISAIAVSVQQYSYSLTSD